MSREDQAPPPVMVKFIAADLNAGHAEDGDLTVSGTDADTGNLVVVRFDGGLARALRRYGLRRLGAAVNVSADPAATILSRTPRD